MSINYSSHTYWISKTILGTTWKMIIWWLVNVLKGLNTRCWKYCKVVFWWSTEALSWNLISFNSMVKRRFIGIFTQSVELNVIVTSCIHPLLWAPQKSALLILTWNGQIWTLASFWWLKGGPKALTKVYTSRSDSPWREEVSKTQYCNVGG